MDLASDGITEKAEESDEGEAGGDGRLDRPQPPQHIGRDFTLLGSLREADKVEDRSRAEHPDPRDALEDEGVGRKE